MMKGKRLHKALFEYWVQLDAVRAANAHLATVGLELFKPSDIAAALDRVKAWLAKIEKGIGDRELEKLSEDLDEQRLGSFSWDTAVEEATGPVVKVYERAGRLRDRIIDLVQA